jgi:hypothetical protein
MTPRAASGAAATPARTTPATARTTARSTTARTTTARTTTAGARASASVPGQAPKPAGRAVPARPELRLVPAAAPARPRRRVRPELGSGRAPFVLLVVALLIGTTLGLLILNTAIAVDSLKATQLRAANAERAEQVQRLEQQVVSAGTPAQVASAAVAAGLVPAGPAAFLVIAADGSATLRGTPEPAEAPPTSASGSPRPAASSPGPSPATPSPPTPSPAIPATPAG